MSGIEGTKISCEIQSEKRRTSLLHQQRLPNKYPFIRPKRVDLNAAYRRGVGDGYLARPLSSPTASLLKPPCGTQGLYPANAAERLCVVVDGGKLLYDDTHHLNRFGNGYLLERLGESFLHFFEC